MIKELRIQRGYTQAQLAEKAGVNTRMIQKYENNELPVQNMTVKNALALSKALGVTVEELIKQEE